MDSTNDPRKIDMDDVLKVVTTILQAAGERATEARSLRDQQVERQNAHLHPEQAAITYGSRWIGFPGDDLLVFGEVPPLAEFQAPKDIVFEAEVERDMSRHYLPCFTYSRIHREGMPAYVPAGRVWPIHPEVFEAAKLCGWDWDTFDDGLKAHILIARTAYQAHKQVTA